MDFITGFLKTSRKHYFIMVLVNKLTKASHFILVKSTNSTSVAAEFFIREIMRLHIVPKKIVSNRGSRFTSRFSK